MQPYGSESLWDLFTTTAREHGRRAAVEASDGALTFSELHAAADAVAAELSAAGIREVDCVAQILPNGLAFVPVFLALARLHVRVLLVSPAYQRAELRAIASRLGPSWWVAPASFGDGQDDDELVFDRVREVPVAPGVMVRVLRPARRAAGTATFPDDTLLVKLSSGSTGEPKGIALGTRQLLAEAANVVDSLRLTAGDRVLAPVPIFHSYGFDLGVLPCLTAGATLVLPGRFVPRSTARALAGAEVSVFLGVPAMYRTLLDACAGEALDLSRPRWLLSCTAPLNPALVADFHAAFHAPICQHYGSSEAGGVTTHVPAEVLRRPASVGVPMCGVRVRVLAADGSECPPGVEGEVVVDGPQVARAYVSGAPEGPSPLEEGRFRTGDLGAFDTDGFLHLRGRRDRLINVGGLKVSPLEVQQVLEGFAGVREAAVLGGRDALGEEVVHAVVSLRSPCTEAELLDFCRRHLADYKVPRRIEIRDELPRGASGKVQLGGGDLR